MIILPDGLPSGIPEEHGLYTLGWDVLTWAEDELTQPDGPNAGEPWRWTDQQARIVLWWYAVHEDGRWVFRRGQIVLPKGAGKSPIAAGISCCDLAGPAMFDGIRGDGTAAGRVHPSPRVQLAAVSQDQTDNTMSLIGPMLREGPAHESIPGLDIGVTRILTRNGVLRPVTASASSREGERTTSAVLDETHLWTESNGGHRLARTIRRNIGKMGGRSLETTNTWTPGEESVAELTALYADKLAERAASGGNPFEGGLMRYHPQVVVPDLKDIDEVKEALAVLYKDSPWVDQERLLDEIYDPGTHPSDARRFYLNQVAKAADSLVAPEEWDANQVADELRPKDEIVLGFDGGKTDDATVLVAMRLSDRFSVMLGCWEAPDGPESKTWEVPRDEVDAAVAAAFRDYQPLAFFADVALWESYIDKWSVEYNSRLLIRASTKSAIARDMRGGLEELTRGCERLVRAIADGVIKHDGDRRLRRHVLNARRRLNKWGVSFGKENRESPKKVDGFSALLLADMARVKLVESGKKPKKPGRVVALA